MTNGYSEHFPGIGEMRFRHSARREAHFIYREVFESRDYERHGITIRPGDVVVDAGANIGFFTVFAIQKAGKGGRIFSFEPIPETFEYLAQNTRERARAAGCELTLFRAGLTAQNGPAEIAFTYFPNLPGNSTIHPDEKDAEAKHGLDTLLNPIRYIRTFRRVSKRRPYLALPLAMVSYPFVAPLILIWLHRSFGVRKRITCPLKSLSDVLQEYKVDRVDFLKVDTEGADLDVLDGLTPEDWVKVRQVVLEIYDADGRLDGVLSRLAAAGFKDVIADPMTALSEMTKDRVYLVYAKRG